MEDPQGSAELCRAVHLTFNSVSLSVQDQVLEREASQSSRRGKGQPVHTGKSRKFGSVTISGATLS